MNIKINVNKGRAFFLTEIKSDMLNYCLFGSNLSNEDCEKRAKELEKIYKVEILHIYRSENNTLFVLNHKLKNEKMK
jgi:hypothetical protein